MGGKKIEWNSSMSNIKLFESKKVHLIGGLVAIGNKGFKIHSEYGTK